jgi:carbonic anhydrase
MFVIYSLYHALGPATWCKDFPIANGKRQSPIDIVPGSVTFDAKLASAPLIIKYLQ